MRAFVILLAVPSLALAADIQVSWQGRLLDATGAVIDGTHTVDLRIWNAQTDGTAVYTERFTDVDVQSGYLSVILGEGGGLDSSMFDGAVYLGVTVDPPATELSPRQRITATPGGAGGGAVLAFVPGVLEIGTSDNLTDASSALTLANLGGSDAAGLVFVAPPGFAHEADTCAGGLAAGNTCTVTFSVTGSGAHGARSGTATASGTGTNTASATLRGSYQPIGTEGAPGASCKQIRQQLTDPPSDVYWLDVDGSAGSTPKFQAYCDMTTAGGGWTLVARIQSNSRKHVSRVGYGGTPMPSGGVAKISDAVINSLRTNTDPAGAFSNAFWFQCDGATSDQYFSSACTFDASNPIIASGSSNPYTNPCHNWAPSAASASYNTGYADTNDCGVGGHASTNTVSSYGWHEACRKSDAEIAAFPPSETRNTNTGCGRNENNSPGNNGRLWVR